jgi:hypothetical protein
MYRLKQINKPISRHSIKSFEGHSDITVLIPSFYQLQHEDFAGKNTTRYWMFNSNIYVWWKETKKLVQKFWISLKTDRLIKMALPSQILNLYMHLGANVMASFNSLCLSEDNVIYSPNTGHFIKVNNTLSVSEIAWGYSMRVSSVPAKRAISDL